MTQQQWRDVEQFPIGSERAAWAYYIAPLVELETFATQFSAWLYEDPTPFYETSSSPTTSMWRQRAATLPVVMQRLTIEGLSEFYAELVRINPATRGRSERDLAMIAFSELPADLHSFSRFGSFLDDPGGEIVLDPSTLPAPIATGVAEVDPALILGHLQDRIGGWREVWMGCREWQQHITAGGAFDTHGDWEKHIARGVARVTNASQQLVTMNRLAAAAIVGEHGCHAIDRGTLHDWLRRGIIDVDLVAECLDEQRTAPLRELQELFRTFRSAKQQQQLVDFCSGILATPDGACSDEPIVNAIMLARMASVQQPADTPASDNETFGQWAARGLILTELPNELLKWAATQDPGIAQLLDGLVRQERAEAASLALEVTRLWQARDADHPPTQLLADAIARRRARLDVFEQALVQDHPELSGVVMAWVRGLCIDRARVMSGLFMSGGRYRRAAPMPFVAALASEVIAIKDIIVIAPDIKQQLERMDVTANALLSAYAQRWSASRLVNGETEHNDELVTLWQNAIARHGSDMLNALWSAVALLERTVAPDRGQDYQAAILTQLLGSSPPRNPIDSCIEADQHSLANAGVLDDILRLRDSMREARWDLIRMGADLAVTNPEDRERIGTRYDAAMERRFTLLDQAAALLMQASRGMEPHSVASTWRLVIATAAGIDDPYLLLEQALRAACDLDR